MTAPSTRRAMITLFYVIITYNDVMAPDNPFVYGEIVTAAAFADREEERARLGGDLAAGQKVFLISPRRYGKSSLVRDVMRGLARQKILTVEVTVASSSSYIGFLESYAQALVAADTPAEPAAALGRRAARRHPARGPLRRRPGRPHRGSRSGSPRCGRRATRRASPRKCSRCRAGSPRRAAADGHCPRRVPGDCLVQRRHRSSMRCAPRCRNSGRSATCSPVPSRR